MNQKYKIVGVRKRSETNSMIDRSLTNDSSAALSVGGVMIGCVSGINSTHTCEKNMF